MKIGKTHAIRIPVTADRFFPCSFIRSQDVPHDNFGVVVALVPKSPRAVLNRFRGTPLETGEALLAPVVPAGLFFAHRDIRRGAHPEADPAAVAPVIGPEFFIH
jgi:hypothetical protein